MTTTIITWTKLMQKQKEYGDKVGICPFCTDGKLERGSKQKNIKL